MTKKKNSICKDAHTLEFIVHHIKGHCPVYKKGDKITIKDPKIILNKTDALCTHALSTLLHYSTILQHN